MFKPSLVAAVFGLLFAGNVLAVENGHLSGLIARQTLDDAAAQPGAARMTTASANSGDEYRASAGAFNGAAIETVDAGSMAGSTGLPATETLNLDGDFSTEDSPRTRNASVTKLPPKDWLLILAGLGMVGVMVERTKRRVV